MMPFRCVAIICGLAILASCGFRPVHGGKTGALVTEELAAIELPQPRNRLQQVLFNALAKSLNPDSAAADKLYTLTVLLERQSEALAIQLDDTITRFDLLFEVRFFLRENGQNEVIYQGISNQISSYNVVRQPFATLVSEQDAERRALEGIADQMRSRIAAFFDSRLR